MGGFYKFWQIGLAIVGWCAIGEEAKAQSLIVPDDTLGEERSVVLQNFGGQPDEVITGGATRGINLLHSFREFNVDVGRRAYFFSSSANIQNIFSRVTGTNLSNINGVLGTYGNSSPNLYLINPNGIIFGREASLDVGGSFTATTASAVGFGNRGIFSAFNPELPSQLLTINPSAFLFTQTSVKPIISRSVTPAISDNSFRGLRVSDGQNLTLLGGNISIDGGGAEGGLTAFGRINIGAIAGTGAVKLDAPGDLTVPAQIERANVTISNRARLDVRGGGTISLFGGNIQILNNSALIAGTSGITQMQRARGQIRINAFNRISIEETSFIGSVIEDNNVFLGGGADISINTGSLVLTDGSQIGASISGRGNAGNVIINARGRVFFDGGNRESRSSGAFSIVDPRGIGNGGNIQITTGSLSLTNGAQLSSATRGQGNAGNVSINARDHISFDGTSRDGRFASGAFSFIEQGGIGSGGDIQIATGSLSLTNGAQLTASTFGQGNAGSVIINARDRISLDNGDVFSSVEQGAVGKGGNIQITTGLLSITNGAQLSSATFGQGNAGNVSINARDQITLDGVGREGRSSGVFVGNLLSQSGQPGDISLNTTSLYIADGAVLNSSTFNPEPGGSITVNANSLLMMNGGQLLTITGASGRAGNIILNANNIQLSGRDATFAGRLSQFGRTVTANEGNGESGLFVGTRPFSNGAGGSITVNANRLFLNDSATFSAQSLGAGNAGSLRLNVSDRFQLTYSILITAASRSSGGNILVNAGSDSGLLVLENGDITTTSQGIGGNITLGGSGTVALADSDILASSQNSAAGNITFEAPAFLQNVFRLSPGGTPEPYLNDGQVDIVATGSVAGRSLRACHQLDKLG